MPSGPGTYGKKRGRPPKKGKKKPRKRTSSKKMKMGFY